MERKYKVRFFENDTYEVIEVITTYGERINAYESVSDTVEENQVYQGALADCEAYIRLKEGGYM